MALHAASVLILPKLMSPVLTTHQRLRQVNQSALPNVSIWNPIGNSNTSQTKLLIASTHLLLHFLVSVDGDTIHPVAWARNLGVICTFLIRDPSPQLKPLGIPCGCIFNTYQTWTTSPNLCCYHGLLRHHNHWLRPRVSRLGAYTPGSTRNDQEGAKKWEHLLTFATYFSL